MIVGAFLYRLVYYAFGLSIPAYNTFKVLSTGRAGADLLHLRYWTCLALFTVSTAITDAIVGSWFPFYYDGKTAFLLWLAYPNCNGASVVYESMVAPTLEEHQEAIDEKMEQVRREGTAKAKAWVGVLWERFRGVLGAGMQWMMMNLPQRPQPQPAMDPIIENEEQEEQENDPPRRPMESRREKVHKAGIRMRKKK